MNEQTLTIISHSRTIELLFGMIVCAMKKKIESETRENEKNNTHVKSFRLPKHLLSHTLPRLHFGILK